MRIVTTINPSIISNTVLSVMTITIIKDPEIMMASKKLIIAAKDFLSILDSTNLNLFIKYFISTAIPFLLSFILDFFLDNLLIR